MQTDRIPLTSITIHPQRINTYFTYTGPRPRYSEPLPRPPSFENNYHQGRISPVARKKIDRAVDYMIHLAKPKRLTSIKHRKDFFFKLNFITLTLSSTQVHTDVIIKNCLLNQFFIEAQKKWKVHNYIWRAEKQANGNLHFHIITDRFIPWSELRNVWNRLQQKLGYVTRYRENRIAWHAGGFRYDGSGPAPRSKEDQVRAWRYGVKTGWESPNSTDIHSIKKIRNLAGYFKKYMSKSDQAVDIQGRLWGCSYDLSRVRGAREDIYSEIDNELRLLKSLKSVKFVHSDFYSVFFVRSSQLKDLGCPILHSLFDHYIRDTFPDYYPPSLFN